MSFNKNLVVAGFTLALLVASSYGGRGVFSGAEDPSNSELISSEFLHVG
jgi:hypothetical protein